MELISNGVEQGETAVLALSGYLAPTLGYLVQSMFEAYRRRLIAAFTFDKAGTANRGDEKFCVSQGAADIISATEQIKRFSDDIIVIGNSISVPSCIEALSDHGDGVSQFTGIAPVLDLETAILNRLKCMGESVPKINASILKALGEYGDTNLDIPKVLEEIEEYRGGNKLVQKLCHISEDIEVKFFLNQQDRIINPNLVQGARWCEIFWTPEVAGDDSFHQVPVSSIIAKI